MSSAREKAAEVRRRQKGHIRAWLRPRLFRPAMWAVAAATAAAKALPFLRPLLPRRMREFVSSWDWAMLRVVITSFGGRAYMDQPCAIKAPPTFEPLVEAADPGLRLSAAEVRGFYEDGFLGPFTLCPPGEMARLREELQGELERPSGVYKGTPGPGGRGRDRHLDCPAMWKLIRRPEWTERVAQLLGPDLLLWRSQVFLKPPGAPEVTWHQASTFLSEAGSRPTLFPPDRDRLFECSIWLALDDVDLENGCLQLVRGSHRRINTVRLGGRGSGRFAAVRFAIEADITPDRVVTMAMRAGQFVIFTERTIHGSPPNNSDRRRCGLSLRTVRPDTAVYGAGARHRVFYLGEDFSLENWGAVVLRGAASPGVNKLVDPFPVAGPGQ
jgi:non-heme Fe2+,alpha-ketoglutarate-dependent halogenase